MSVSITCEHVIKRFGQLTIIPDLTLKVRDGEFFTLLGPSGCGKTTLLRMIAGFNSIEGGSIYFDTECINTMPPDKRNIGMVFQNYAVFPHMSVRKNVAFGLENRPVKKQDIQKRVDEILQTVKITELADRMPDKLSGGQQQRVALARAIVIHPNVLLMDEPLSNLDAKLRLEMRNAIKMIQKEVGITTVYVTHDQEEAMAVSDRIAVMNAGVIQHVGTPKNIYQRPANLFVAGFIGRSNILPAKLTHSGGAATITFDNGYAERYEGLRDGCGQDADVRVCVRPEEFVLSTDNHGITGVIASSVFLGLNTTYFITLDNGESVEIIEESSIHNILEDGTRVALRLKLDKINVFSGDGEKNMTRGVQNDLDRTEAAHAD